VRSSILIGRSPQCGQNGVVVSRRQFGQSHGPTGSGSAASGAAAAELIGAASVAHRRRGVTRSRHRERTTLDPD